MSTQVTSVVGRQGLQATLEDYLRELKLTMFLEHYQAYAKDAVRTDLSSERFLLALCEGEASHRLAKKINYCMAQAKFPFLKELATYDFTAVDSLPKARFLELAQGEYMANAENILLLESPGLGKTHLAQRDLTLSEMMAKFARLDLLILDELGFIAVDKEGANLLFQLISDLYERVSIVITSNLRFQEWTSIFGSATLTQSVIERLIHRGNIFEFVGESYRYRHRLQQDGTAQEESTPQAG